jgi:uncharacterized protein YraI
MASQKAPSRLTLGIAVALLAVPPAARAEADGPDYFRVTGVAADDVLNIRAAPSPRARILGAIPPDGNGIRNRGCRGGLSFAEWERASPAAREAADRRRWCRVTWRGMTGWVAGRFLAEGRAP